MLTPAELSPEGFPLEPLCVSPLNHRGALFWLARYPSLPGYAGGGKDPHEALSQLMAQFDGGPIYRVTIKAYSKKKHASWVEGRLRAQHAAAEMEGVRDSKWVADLAKKRTVRKSSVHDADRRLSALMEEARITDPAVKRHLERASASPQNRELGRWLLENLRPDEVEWRWAREKFPPAEPRIS